ncbi:MAG: hypothetical protein ACOYNL_07080 [Rickettsiales bacterium]
MARNTSVNWGGVIKGVAIVSAVVVAGAVGAWALGAAWGAIGTAAAGEATTSALAGTAYDGITTAASWLSTQWAAFSTYISSVWTGLASSSALTGALTTAQVTSGVPIAQVVGGVAAAGAAATVALPAMRDIPMSQLDAPDPYIAQNAQHHASHGAMHTATETTRHIAAESGQRQSSNLVSRFGTKAANDDSFVQREAARRNSAPGTSFSESLNADRANLEAAIHNR